MEGSGQTDNALTSAAAFWERGRVGYNGILCLVVAAWLIATWPHFRPALTKESGLLLVVLAALANACYCAAYPVDLVLQRILPVGNRSAWRLPLWCIGSLFAVVLACYWIADEVYPFVGVPAHG